MTKSVLILMFSLLVYSGFSQREHIINADSLLTELALLTESQTSIDAYLQEIRKFFRDGMPSNQEDFLLLIQSTIEKAKELNDQEGLAWAHYYLGKFYIGGSRGYSNALPSLLEAISIFEGLNNNFGVSECYMQMGLISYMTQYYEDAIKNFNLSLSFAKNPTSTYLMAISYAGLNNYAESKKQFHKALASFKRAKRANSINECYMYLGEMYVRENNLDSAYYYLNKAIQNQQKLKNSFSRPYALVSEYYLAKGDLDSAEYYALASIELATNGNQDFISPLISTETLSEVYDRRQNFEKAHFYLKKHYSLKNDQFQGGAKQKIAEMQTIFEFKKKIQEEELRHEKELREKNRTKNVYLITALFVLLMAGALYSRLIYVRKSKTALQSEKNISEKLLLNILPEEIAQELKDFGKTEARDFNTVSILFTDFKEFTEIAQKLSAAELVSEINHCFEAFDHIIEKYRIEKIKTIGDAYMAAGGLPVPTNDSVKNTVLAALEMQDFITKRKAEMDKLGKEAFEMRIGIHTGPVVAGIVGVKKFQYDVWGDTVNTASRMESAGEVGKVNISQETYELLKDDPDFVFESRGKIQVKGKGEMEMWFVSLTS